MTKSPVFHGTSERIEIKQYFIREQVNVGGIDEQCFSTQDQVADGFTKPLVQ